MMSVAGLLLPIRSIDIPTMMGNYEPGNVRWATLVEQRANTRPPIWERIVLLLAGTEFDAVRAMVKAYRQDEEIARHIAAVFRYDRATTAAASNAQ